MVEAAFEICTDEAGRGLGPQGELSAPAILESIQLFGDGISVFTYAFYELDVLDDRGHDLLVTEPHRDLGRRPLGGAPERSVARE